MTRFENIGFRVFNRLERFVGKRLPRTSSYPFLACDTYFSECDLAYVDHDSNFLKTLSDVDSASGLRDISIYCPAEKVPKLISELEGSEFRKIGSLLVGDSDEVLSDSLTMSALRLFERAYLVNRKSDGSRIFNLPIGLENKSYSSPLRLNLYKRHKNYRRKHGLLVCWNDDTNLISRRSARIKLNRSITTLSIEKRIPFQLLARHTQESYLVACPAGNGIDSHRIWESLYLGSLPVMLEEDASIFDPIWPIHRVDDWDQLSSLTLEKAHQIFEVYRARIESIVEVSENFISQITKRS